LSHFNRKQRGRQRKQKGLATVEMAIVSSVFLTVLLGIIEVGRLMFTLNVLDEVTRRGARLAAVCPVSAAEQAAIKNTSVFSGNLINSLGPQHLAISYLKNDGSAADPATEFSEINYVRARITGFTYQLLIPFSNLSLNLPDFSTTSPAESLGVVPAPPVGEASYGTVSCL